MWGSITAKSMRNKVAQCSLFTPCSLDGHKLEVESMMVNPPSIDCCRSSMELLFFLPFLAFIILFIPCVIVWPFLQCYAYCLSQSENKTVAPVYQVHVDIRQLVAENRIFHLSSQPAVDMVADTSVEVVGTSVTDHNNVDSSNK